ncbi:MAG: peptidoglycan DD-metalloendopeptidase family protein [Methylophaga sp.]|nr:peptidoglycan DD-metalloendopeptidase family protein [Methylophaga sp.]
MTMASLVLILLSSALITVGHAQDSTQQLESVRDEIKTLSQDLASNKADKESLYKQLQVQSMKVSAISRELASLNEKIRTQDRQLTVLNQQLDQQQMMQSEQLEALYEQLRAAFINSQPGYMKMLLNQQDPALLSRGNVYYRYFNDARRQQLEEIDQVLASLSDEQKQVFAAQRELQSLYETQKQKQASLQAQTEARQATLAALDQKIASQDARLSELRSQEQQLQNLIDSLARQQAKRASPPSTVKPTQPFTSLNGRLNWPVRGKVLAHYGSSRNVGTLKWQGIMIDSAPGTDVKAVASGRVVFSEWLRGFGLLIIVDHGDQFMSLYGNNDALLKDVGDTVTVGETIAQTGNQGIRQQAGLYFEIRHKGQPVNPVNWLEKRS